MKAGREHRVPFSSRATEILVEVTMGDPGDDLFVFAGNKPGQPLSNMAFLMLFRRMNRTDITAYGFRSTFRD